MAGIGFELRKLYNRGGLLSKQRAYAYAGIVYSGPMLLGILLTVGVVVLAIIGGVSEQERDHLLSMMTYAMIFSLAITTLFSLIVTRYVADMLYENKQEKILPSFFASSALMLLLGSPIYWLYLSFASRNFWEGLLGLLLFGELCLVWNVITYLTAIKSYRQIIYGFILAILLTLLVGSLSLVFALPQGLLLSVCLAYAVMCFWLVKLVLDYFPSNHQPSFEFLTWFDDFGDLAMVGIASFIGLFAHIAVNWFGPLSRSQSGFFPTAPVYDVPAMMAFLTTLVTTLNFVISVEVSFYPRYMAYFSLFNQEGSLFEIKQAESRMLDTLSNELKYVLWKQLLTTILAMFVGGVLLTYLPIGFNSQMQGYFLTLCLGYGLYAVGNVNLLLLLYFTDYKGAKQAAFLFAGLSLALSIVSQFLNPAFYGFGFLLASLVLYIVGSRRLAYYTSDLPYHFLGQQAMVAGREVGFFGRLLKRF